jgi:hypothetical protein
VPLCAGLTLKQIKPMAPQQGKEIQYSPSEKPTSNMANPYGTKMIQLFTQEQYQSLVYNQV